jgi:hypothetical protein
LRIGSGVRAHHRRDPTGFDVERAPPHRASDARKAKLKASDEGCLPAFQDRRAAPALRDIEFLSQMGTFEIVIPRRRPASVVVYIMILLSGEGARPCRPSVC